MNQGHHSWYPVKYKLGLIDKLLLEHVGLPHILDLAEGAIEVSFEVPHEVPNEVSHEVPLK